MSISRRDTLMGATVAVAVAAIPSTVQADDAHLAALDADWRRAWHKWSDDNAAADETHMEALRACGPSPVDSDYTNAAELAAAWSAWGAARKAAAERPSVVALQRQAKAADDAQEAAFERFMEAPAQTPRGVLLKLRAGMDLDEWLGEPGLLGNPVLVAIHHDLERLAGEARS